MDDMLQRAIDAMRDAPASDLPDSVRAETTRAVTRRVVQLRWRRRVTRVAIAASVALGLASAGWLLNRGPAFTPVSMAAVLDAVSRTRSMSVDVHYEWENRPVVGKRPTMRIVAHGTLVRIGDELPASIIDLSSGKKMTFVETSRTARLTYVSPGEYDVVSRVRQLSERVTIPAGRERIDGVECDVFVGEAADPLAFGYPRSNRMRLWADPVTHLPKRLEVLDPRLAKRTVYDRFEWDAPVDDTLFNVAIPAGYKLERGPGIPMNELKPRVSPDVAAAMTIEPGIGMGGITLGDPPERVRELLGEPESVKLRNADSPYGNIPSTYWYSSLGLTVSFEHDLGVSSIIAWRSDNSAFLARDFPGKTPGGVGMGSRFEDFVKEFGPPETPSRSLVGSRKFPKIQTMVQFDPDGRITCISISTNVKESRRDPAPAEPASPGAERN